MFFGKKKNKSIRPADSSSRKGVRRDTGSQSEIELACRDLMLASLESMRKDVISRPQAVGPAKDFDIAEKVNADIASELHGSVSQRAVSEINEISAPGNCAPDDAVCSSPVNIHKKNGTINFGTGKQRIIDLIAAEDIGHAFVSRKEMKVL